MSCMLYWFCCLWWCEVSVWVDTTTNIPLFDYGESSIVEQGWCHGVPKDACTNGSRTKNNIQNHKVIQITNRICNTEANSTKMTWWHQMLQMHKRNPRKQPYHTNYCKWIKMWEMVVRSSFGVRSEIVRGPTTIWFRTVCTLWFQLAENERKSWKLMPSKWNCIFGNKKWFQTKVWHWHQCPFDNVGNQCKNGKAQTLIAALKTNARPTMLLINGPQRQLELLDSDELELDESSSSSGTGTGGMIQASSFSASSNSCCWTSSFKSWGRRNFKKKCAPLRGPALRVWQWCPSRHHCLRTRATLACSTEPSKPRVLVHLVPPSPTS